MNPEFQRCLKSKTVYSIRYRVSSPNLVSCNSSTYLIVDILKNEIKDNKV